MAEAGGGAAGPRVGERAEAERGAAGQRVRPGPCERSSVPVEGELRCRRLQLGKRQQRLLLALAARVAVEGLPARFGAGWSPKVVRGWRGRAAWSRGQPGVQPRPVGDEGLM